MYGPVTQGETFQFAGQMLLDDAHPLVTVASGLLVFAPVVGEPATNERFVATGTVTVTDGTTGAYTFAPSTADLGKLLAGDWVMQMAATLTSGQLRYSSAMQLRVVAPL